MHKRKSLRLKGYDYTKDGLYFITICVWNRQCSFGKIENNEMILNAVGDIANQYWVAISEHYQPAVLHEHVVMPNHIHGIIELCKSNNEKCHIGNRVGTSHGMSLREISIVNTTMINETYQRHPIDRKFGKPIPGSLSTIINQYKSSVKRWCNKNNYENFRWQSKFFDHIIRSEEDYIRISDYVLHNPAKWIEDIFYTMII